MGQVLEKVLEIKAKEDERQKRKKPRNPLVSRLFYGCSCQARTDDIMINSHALYRLS